MILSFIIIALTVGTSIYAWKNDEVFNKLKLNPYMVIQRQEYARLLGHGFLHADYSHLIFNMFTLYFFGGFVERYFRVIFDNGNMIFILFYLIAIAVSSTPALIKHKNNHYYSAVGASGAISAVLFTSILLDPFLPIGFLLIPIRIPGFVFGILYIIISLYLSKKNMDNIGHDAHIAGAVFGIIFPIVLKPSLINHFINTIIS